MNQRFFESSVLLPLTLSIIALSGIASADQWPGPRTITGFSKSGQYFVRITPGESVGDTFGFAGQKKGDYAKGEFYERQKNKNYKLIWEAFLLNPVSPVDIFVSDAGYLVTLDNWHNMGYGKVLVIYDSTGKVVQGYELDELFPKEKIQLIPRSVSSRYWRDKPVHFISNQEKFYVPDRIGGYFVFDLKNGSFDYKLISKK